MRPLLSLLFMSIAIFLVVLCSGCETYKKIPYTPDGLNYNHYFNDDKSAGQESIGISWTLK